MASNATTGATVTCKCSVVLPADTKDDSFSADVSLVAIYAFSRVSKTFERDTLVEVSPRVMLLCGVPTFLFLVLLVAYRFIPHRVFSYQRGGHLSDEEKSDEEKKEWWSGRMQRKRQRNKNKRGKTASLSVAAATARTHFVLRRFIGL